MLNNTSILITGGTGSFGKHLIKTVLKQHQPKRIVVYSRDELKQFDMQNSESFENEKVFVRYFIGDIRDFKRLKKAMEDVNIVVHAAALKQVPATEYNPFEAVKTNVIGAQNVIDAAFEANVQKVVALSSDKASAPINLYGATKLTSDKLFIAANNHKGKRDVIFSVVRYGNVMGSRGSVIPFFLKQKENGVLNITDNRMTRFNITLQQGVDFVLQCIERMWGGELFVPKIPSYRILDVAEAVAPECKQNIVGIRPGEKLHEDMITQSDALNTIEYENYYVIVPSIRIWSKEKFMNKSNFRKGRPCEEGFSYNSNTNQHFLSVSELKKLIEENVTL